MADRTEAAPKYTSCEDIIIQIAKREGYPDWEIQEILNEGYEKRNAHSDVDLWTENERSSWYGYRLWRRLCKYILMISSRIFI
jgi:hypothetical protein